jgi:hypothetical protein
LGPSPLKYYQVIAVHYLGAIVIAKQGDNLPGVNPLDSPDICRAVIGYAAANADTLRVIDINDITTLAFTLNALDAGR